MAESMLVPTDAIESTVATVIEEARAATDRLFDLPHGEGVDLEIVRDVPWLAFCEYRGGSGAASPSTSTCR